MNMNIKQNSSINFQAKLSETIRFQVFRQLNNMDRHTNYQKKLFTQVDEQLKNIEKWGDDSMEIVRAQSPCGRLCLGLKLEVIPKNSFTHYFEHLNGKTELSQFLALKERHIFNTAEKIKKIFLQNIRNLEQKKRK